MYLINNSLPSLQEEKKSGQHLSWEGHGIFWDLSVHHARKFLSQGSSTQLTRAITIV
eukprot:m.1641256 g.1641256  ORF g.1641256 m.1641256 type:complete len:57 (-) comp46503_c0_seq1:79-249(-)